MFSRVEVNSTLHPSGVAESITSFGWGKGVKFTAAGWHVTPCDPIRLVIFTNYYIRFTLLYTIWESPGISIHVETLRTVITE